MLTVDPFPFLLVDKLNDIIPNALQLKKFLDHPNKLSVQLGKSPKNDPRTIIRKRRTDLASWLYTPKCLVRAGKAAMYCQSMSGACRITSSKHRATLDSCGTVLALRQLAIRCFLIAIVAMALVVVVVPPRIGVCVRPLLQVGVGVPSFASGLLLLLTTFSCCVLIFLSLSHCLCCWFSPPTLQPGTIHFSNVSICCFDSFFVPTNCSDKFLSHFTSGS